MFKQKNIIKIEGLGQSAFNNEYVVLSRDEYNLLAKQFYACKIVYSNEKKPYYIPIKKKGLRGNSQVNTLNAYVFKEIWSDEKLDFKMLGNVSDQEFLMIAQAFNLNFNLPIDRK